MSEPLFQVLRGHPTDEEVTALALVLTAKLAASQAADRGGRGGAPRHAGGWADPARAVRPALTPAPGAWRASARPR